MSKKKTSGPDAWRAVFWCLRAIERSNPSPGSHRLDLRKPKSFQGGRLRGMFSRAKLSPQPEREPSTSELEPSQKEKRKEGGPQWRALTRGTSPGGIFRKRSVVLRAVRAARGDQNCREQANGSQRMRGSGCGTRVRLAQRN